MTVCIRCREPEAGLFRGDDGRHRCRCAACGYEWGPFTSSTTTARREAVAASERQPSLSDYSGGSR